MNILPPVRIPAADDGVIDKNDIESGSIFAIIGYVNSSPGDFIKLYLDTSEVGSHEVQQADGELTVIHIPTLLLTDGEHLVNYDVTDLAGNTSKSSDLHIFVDSTHDIKKLPAPEIRNGEDGCLSLDEINQSDGAFITIWPSNEFQKYKGDMIYFHWDEYDISGLPIEAGTVSSNWLIDDAFIADGKIVKIDKSQVLLAENGGAFCFFYIQTGAERIYSQESRVSIGNCDNGQRTLTLNADKYNVLANGIDNAVLTATVADRAGVPLPLQTIIWDTSLNNLSQLSTITDSAGHSLNTLSGTYTGTSTVTATLNDGTACSVAINFTRDPAVLPPPEYPQASNGQIEQLQIEIAKGVQVICRYSDLKLGDTVRLTVTGFDANGTPIPEAGWEKTNVLDRNDVNNGYSLFLIPTDVAESVGDAGMLLALYEVTNPSGSRVSEKADVEISLDNKGKLVCTIANGAPPYDPQTIDISPSNAVKVSGKPGIEISIACSVGGIIVESETTEMVRRLDQNGILYFHVRAATSGAVTLNIFQMDDPGNSCTGVMQFDNYRIGEAPFYAYGKSTGALADGIMPCSLYIVTNDSDNSGTPLTVLRVNLQNESAHIIGYPTNPADIPLNAQHAADIQIVASQATDLDVQITLPESSGHVINLDVNFV